MLFLSIVLGAAQLLARAALQTAAGRAATAGANLTRSRAEELARSSFDGPALRIESGFERRVTEYWDPAEDRWQPGRPPASSPWLRTIVVRQYPSSALADGALSDDEAVAGGANPALSHLKEIRVTVRPGGRGPVGARTRPATYRLLKSY